jgi:hypothetical protein
MKKLKHFFYVLVSLTMLPSQIKTNKTRIYKDNVFHVDDIKLDDNRIERTFAPNQLNEETIYGPILLSHVDLIVVPYLKLMLSALFFQEIDKPKRILCIGLGIGILPRALNYMLNNTLHIDVVEIGRIAFLFLERFWIEKSQSY